MQKKNKKTTTWAHGTFPSHTGPPFLSGLLRIHYESTESHQSRPTLTLSHSGSKQLPVKALTHMKRHRNSASNLVMILANWVTMRRRGEEVGQTAPSVGAELWAKTWRAKHSHFKTYHLDVVSVRGLRWDYVLLQKRRAYNTIVTDQPRSVSLIKNYIQFLRAYSGFCSGKYDRRELD